MNKFSFVLYTNMAAMQTTSWSSGQYTLLFTNNAQDISHHKCCHIIKTFPSIAPKSVTLTEYNILFGFQMEAFRAVDDGNGQPLVGNYRPPCPLHSRSVTASF